MIITAFNGSPVKDGNCEIIIKQVLAAAQSLGAEANNYHLNDFPILPCQSCGESPYPEYCFFDGGLQKMYRDLLESDVIIFASPVHFDTVSAQSKLFIDRCNCIRPAIFPDDLNDEPDEVQFLKRDLRGRKGIIILSGGQRQKFHCARTVIKGFFKWTGIEFYDEIDIRSSTLRKGVVIENDELMEKAYELGRGLL
ncbi:MAG: hypothetical protein GF307_13620 [candidate division Zixibacteria bacterium]|nr:hypothetical protein [candidate division Zixibacteria bacterium]